MKNQSPKLIFNSLCPENLRILSGLSKQSSYSTEILFIIFIGSILNFMRNPQQPRRRSLAATRVEPIQVAQQPRQPRYADITARLDTLERNSERDRDACKEAAKKLRSAQWKYFLFICTVIIGSGIGAYYHLSSRIDGLGSRIDTLDSTLGSRIDSLGSTLGSRIDGLGSRIDSLVDHFSACNCSLPK